MVCVISSPAAVGKAHTETQEEMEWSEMLKKGSQMFKIRDWDPGQFTSSFIRFELLLESSLGALRGMICSLMSLPLTHGQHGGKLQGYKAREIWIWRPLEYAAKTIEVKPRAMTVER